MGAISIEDLYDRYIKPLTPEEQRQLLTITAKNLAPSAQPPKRSIMELHGLGAEIWHGIDAQAYVNALRDEWDERL